MQRPIRKSVTPGEIPWLISAATPRSRSAASWSYWAKVRVRSVRSLYISEARSTVQAPTWMPSSMMGQLNSGRAAFTSIPAPASSESCGDAQAKIGAKSGTPTNLMRSNSRSA